MNETPVYTSPSTVRSIWQRYEIYDDRIELHTHFGVLTVPFDTIESVSLEESDLAGLMRGHLKLKNFRPALKLDWANFADHIVVDRSEGRIKRILFTPDDPDAFEAAVLDALDRYHDRVASGAPPDAG